MTKRSQHRGVSLVEVLVGVGIVGVLIAAATPAMSGFIERRRVVAVAGELNNLLAYSKSEANVIAATLDLHVEDDPADRLSCAAVVIQAGLDMCKCHYAADAICPAGGAQLLRLLQVPKDKGVSFKATATRWSDSGDHKVSFIRSERSQRERDLKFTVTGHRTGAQLVIKMNEAGLFSTCSVVGRLGGYPTCS